VSARSAIIYRRTRLSFSAWRGSIYQALESDYLQRKTDSQRNAMHSEVFGNWAHRFTSTTSVFKRYIFSGFGDVFFAGNA
jgi:hypothetical protein